MRIYYAAEYKYPIQKGTRLWYNNLYLPLVDLGYDIIPFDYNITPHFVHLDFNKPANKKFIDENRIKLENALLEQVRSAHRKQKIDVFLSYFYSAICRPEIISEIKEMGIITINWYCNASYQFHLVKDIAPAYDYCLVPEKFRLDDYKNIGANPIYFQEAANPKIYKPYSLNKNIDVSFVGGKYGDRVEWVNYLTSNQVRINVSGSGWKYRSIRDNLKKILKPNEVVFPNKSEYLITHNIISDKEYVELYSKSKISLGFSSCGDTHKSSERILQVRLRDFEAPMSGAFYMTEYQQEIEEFFDVGRELICYHNKEDLVEKAKYYLKHDVERNKIAKAGYNRCIAEHTWQRRFSNLFLNLIKI